MQLTEQERKDLIERQKAFAKFNKIEEMLGEIKRMAWEMQHEWHISSEASNFATDIYQGAVNLMDVVDDSTNAAFSSKTFCKRRH